MTQAYSEKENLSMPVSLTETNPSINNVHNDTSITKINVASI